MKLVEFIQRLFLALVIVIPTNCHIHCDEGYTLHVIDVRVPIYKCCRILSCPKGYRRLPCVSDMGMEICAPPISTTFTPTTIKSEGNSEFYLPHRDDNVRTSSTITFTEDANSRITSVSSTHLDTSKSLPSNAIPTTTFSSLSVTTDVKRQTTHIDDNGSSGSSLYYTSKIFNTLIFVISLITSRLHMFEGLLN